MVFFRIEWLTVMNIHWHLTNGCYFVKFVTFHKNQKKKNKMQSVTSSSIQLTKRNNKISQITKNTIQIHKFSTFLCSLNFSLCFSYLFNFIIDLREKNMILIFVQKSVFMISFDYFVWSMSMDVYLLILRESVNNATKHYRANKIKWIYTHSKCKRGGKWNTAIEAFNKKNTESCKYKSIVVLKTLSISFEMKDECYCSLFGNDVPKKKSYKLKNFKHLISMVWEFLLHCWPV